MIVTLTDATLHPSITPLQAPTAVPLARTEPGA